MKKGGGEGEGGGGELKAGEANSLLFFKREKGFVCGVALRSRWPKYLL
jgi:hypothetical protein